MNTKGEPVMLTRSTTHPNLEVANEVSVRPLYHLTVARGAGDSAEIEEAIAQSSRSPAASLPREPCGFKRLTFEPECSEGPLSRSSGPRPGRSARGATSS